MLKKLILIFLLGFKSFSLNFSIAPTEFEVDLNKNSIHEVYVMNNTAEPLRIEAYTEIIPEYLENNLIDDIVIFPKIISIRPGGNRPGGKQTIRFKVKENKNKQIGVYKNLMVFREVPNRIKKISTNSESQFSTKLSFITEIAIGIKGEKK